MKKQFQVKDGDQITCTLGSKDSTLSVPFSHGTCIQGKNEATVNDCRTEINIQPFGMCMKSQPQVPCTPIILTPWMMGNQEVLVNGEAVLLSGSILSCACGGIIKFKA